MPRSPSGKHARRLAQSFLYSLKTKFIAALILLVGAVISLSAWWNLSLHTGHMLQATEDKVRALAEAIDGGIQVAMREGHTTEVQRILEGMARDPDIERIVIFDDGGRIRQASKRDLVGRVMDRDRLSRATRMGSSFSRSSRRSGIAPSAASVTGRRRSSLAPSSSICRLAGHKSRLPT